MTTAVLPKEFHKLEALAKEWRLPTRLANSTDDLQALRKAVAPRAEERIE